ncbi:MAG: class I SAM-dependent methyltransferase [ANME-2 cluster archaeon]|nr:MAG: class I SAM-dependent methyltransferase [ANME-2 cluster archaeon]
MPSIFWTGRLSPMLKLMVNFSNAIAWATGNARDTAGMKQRVKKGYEGAVTNDVTRYDEFGLGHYKRISNALLERTDLKGKTILDVGCGTGILSFLALELGAAKVVCGDLSEYMLSQCEKKARAFGYKPSQIDFRQLDAESLPFDSGTFDSVISGMILGMVPNQQIALDEMVRVLKPEGTLSISTHGPELYFEACETAFKAIPIGLVLGYRIEFWPRQENDLLHMFTTAGLIDILTRRLTWKERFNDGGKAYDFFASTSSAWWFSKFPPDKVAPVFQKVRRAFKLNNVKEITTDVILAYGRKL